MVVAVGAWIFHVAALALAPMSVVQAVLSGGVVLLAVMAERLFGFEVGPAPVGRASASPRSGLRPARRHAARPRTARTRSFSLAGMIAFEAGLLGVGGLLIMGPRIGAPGPAPRRDARRRRRHPVRRLRRRDQGAHRPRRRRRRARARLSPGSPSPSLASVVAFYASARGLQDGEAVPVIAVTGTAANVAGIAGGIIVFGDPMPGDPLGIVVQVARLRAGHRRRGADARAGARRASAAPRDRLRSASRA